MEVISIRTEKILAAPGVDAFEAEIKTWDKEKREYIYLHYTIFEGNHLTVSHESIMDYMLDSNEDAEFNIEYLETYESLAEAFTSDYVDGFILLHNLLNEMIDLNYGHRDTIYNYIVSPIEFGEIEVVDTLTLTLSATFQYQTKTMQAPAQRKAIVTTCDSFVVECKMYDEEGNMLESFEDSESAERSKWVLLYENMIERIKVDCKMKLDT